MPNRLFNLVNPGPQGLMANRLMLATQPAGGYVSPQDQAALDAYGRLAGGIGQAAQSMGNALYGAVTLPGDVYAGRTDPSSPQGFNRLMDLTGLMVGGGPSEAGATLGSGITAYHGSPHSFDKFDFGKIGTGEGAQAYGHGGYFASAEDVAKSYRDALSGQFILDGKPTDTTGYRNFDIALRNQYGGDLDALEKSFGSKPSAAAQSAVNDLRSRGYAYSPQGNMYEVSINADPDHFLDWDKPLKDQSPAVQAMASSHHDTLKWYRDGEYSTFNPNDVSEYSGEDLVSALRQKAYEQGGGYGKVSVEQEAAEASRALQSSGLPGIRYLDGGSRGVGQGSHNYVVFDHNLVDVARKYGMSALAVGGAGASLVLGPNGLQTLDGKPET